jgi:hypothetical protein
MKLETQEQKQTKVVVLSHVKESSIVYSESVTTTTSSKRIAWPGGNITSNKHEALLKFYQRKIMNGELNEHQLKAAKAACKYTTTWISIILLMCKCELRKWVKTLKEYHK